MTLPDTFWAKATATDCIVWTGAQNTKGYGCFAVNGKSELAHRLVWEEGHGPIPDGMTVDHLCRVHSCIRLDHLELVTTGENHLRGLASAGFVPGGKCARGHDLTEDNIYRRKNRAGFECRECRRIGMERTRAKAS